MSKRKEILTRPILNLHIKPDDFLSFYWLKEKLVIFLREHDLSTTGSKQDLTTRISKFLATGVRENKLSRKLIRRTETMPKIFTRQSVIGQAGDVAKRCVFFFNKKLEYIFILIVLCEILFIMDLVKLYMKQ